MSIVTIEFKVYDVVLHSFCLMSNHYHLLIETKYPNISDAMKRINSLYSIYFNKKYKLSGHLWQGRFRSYYLYDDLHFWYVAKYIERNPIVTNMVNTIDKYKYQSFYQMKFKSDYYLLIKNSKIFDMTQVEYEEFISSDIQEELFEQDRDINRNENIKKAYEYGYTKSELARYLKLSHTAISKVINHIVV